MGTGISRDNRAAFEKQMKMECKTIDEKFRKIEKRNITIVGPQSSGKTGVFRSLMSLPFQSEYKCDEFGRFGNKLFTSIKSKYEKVYPLSMNLVDTPGSLIRSEIAAEHYFSRCDIVLIVFDGGMAIEEETIDKWTQFVLAQISTHNQGGKGAPMVIHLITKLDRSL